MRRLDPGALIFFMGHSPIVCLSGDVPCGAVADGWDAVSRFGERVSVELHSFTAIFGSGQGMPLFNYFFSEQTLHISSAESNPP